MTGLQVASPGLAIAAGKRRACRTQFQEGPKTMDTSTIREHMKVFGSDRQYVGTVDHIEGDQIKLTKSDSQSGGQHHYIPAAWVERVEGDQVCLRQSAREVRSQWKSA
jgi:hypothetical protein